MMQRYQRGSSVRSDATQSSNDAHDDVFGGSEQRLGTIFPKHMVPSTEERVAQANSLMAESFLSRSNAATSHREQQRRTIRQLCVDSDSDSDSYHAPAPVAQVNPTMIESPRPSQSRGVSVPTGSKLPPTQVPAAMSGDGPTSPQLPALRSSPLKNIGRPSSPTPKSHPDVLPAPKVSSPVIVTSADEPHLQPSRGRSPSTYFPPPPVVPPHRTASADALRNPTPPRSRGPGSSRTTPVAASYFEGHHEDGRVGLEDVAHQPQLSRPAAHQTTVDDEPSFEDVYRDYRGSASAERHSTITSRRDEGIARPTAKRSAPVAALASWDSTSPRKSPSHQHTHGSSRISPRRGSIDDASSAYRVSEGPLRYDVSPQRISQAAPRPTMTSPEAAMPLASSRAAAHQVHQVSPLHVRASPIRSDGSSPMESVGSAERARFAAFTSSVPRPSTNFSGPAVATNPMHASLASSARYKSTSPLPPAHGKATPTKATTLANKSKPTPAAPVAQPRATPQGKPKAAQSPPVSLSAPQQSTRANSGSVLSQSGVFATETGQTFGACRCEEHDSLCAFTRDDWLAAFVEYNRGSRSSARLFNLDPIPISSGPRGDAERQQSPHLRRRSAAIGAWCSVDALQRRRADILPPKRYLMIAGGRVHDADTLDHNYAFTSSEASELMIFPQEPYEMETGLVRSLPSASFPLTTRGISHEGNASLVEHHAPSSCTALTFTRIRLAPRKFHLLVEVVGVPLAPLLEENDTILFGSRQTSLNTSSDEYRKPSFAPPAPAKLFEQLISALVHGDEHLDQTADGAQVLAGATIGLFEASLFFETYETLLDITNRNRAWLAERLRDVFDRRESKSSRKQPLQPSEQLAQRQKKLVELFDTIKSPLVPLEFRAPPSLWNATVQRTFQLLDQDASLRSGMSHMTLESLHFRDVVPVAAPSPATANTPTNSNGGILTHDAFGVIKSAVQIPSNILYDVRCLPQNKTQLYCPEACKAAACDGDTAVVLEYISRFPFVQRIYSILADASRYYVVLPPVLSKAVERAKGPQHTPQQEEVMALSDLCRRVSPQLRTLQFMDYVRLVAAQLVLSIGLLHSRGIVVGALTPRRVQCRVTHGTIPSRPTTIETCLTGFGASSAASSWLRQQKGVIEYLSPAFVAQFLDEKLLDPSLEGLSPPPRAPLTLDPPPPPSVGAADDWWAVGCIVFELFSKGTPLFPVEGKGDLLDMWLNLLVNRDTNVPQTHVSIMDAARTNVLHHIEESVHYESDRLLRSWDPAPLLGAAPKTQAAASTSSNLVTRRVEERKMLEKSRNPSPQRQSSQPQVSEERQQWKNAVSEFAEVLSVLCDVQSFTTSPHKEGLCPSDFHGVVVRLMALPFFKGTDWVNVFNQAPGSMSTGSHIVSPLPEASERSNSADSRNGSKASPRRLASKLSKGALAQHRSTTTIAGVKMEASEPSDSGATNDYAQPHPFVMYSAEETAVLVNLLQRKGTARDRDLADAVKRQDVRLHQWSVEAIPELNGRNSFLRPTESYQMYRRAVGERKKQLGSPGKANRDPSPNRAAPAPLPSDVYVIGGSSRTTTTAESNKHGVTTISPLHHSYSFQRPKGFIDVVSDRKAGCVYDPAPQRHQGDVTAYTKPLLSKGSQSLVTARHQGYLDPVSERAKYGAYIPPPPPSKTFGPPPPVPASHGKNAQARLASSITRPHPSGPVVDAPQAYRAWIDTVTGSGDVPEVVLSPPVAAAHRHATHLTSISPETPRSEDPSVALFTSPPHHAPAAASRPSLATSGSTPSGTPANRPAVRLPGSRSDAASDHSGSAATHDARSDDQYTSDASSRVRGRRSSPAAQQRPPRHVQAPPVVLPLAVSSVRPTADAPRDGVAARSHPPHAGGEGRPLPKRGPTTKPLGKWTASDSDDEDRPNKRDAAARAPRQSSPRRNSAPQHLSAAMRELPPPPPPYDPLADDDDDAFS